MHLVCLNTRAHCVSAIGYDGFVFCNLAITSRNYNSRFNPNELYIAKEKKSNWHTILLNFWIIYETRTLSYGALKQCDMCYMGKSKKEKVIMIVVPVNPIGQRKRQDDVLSFQKITGSYYHFIAYLSLLYDRPNSFYHLNFNFFEF